MGILCCILYKFRYNEYGTFVLSEEDTMIHACHNLEKSLGTRSL